MGKKRVSKGEAAFFASICSGGAAQRAAMGRQGAPGLTKALFRAVFKLHLALKPSSVSALGGALDVVAAASQSHATDFPHNQRGPSGRVPPGAFSA